MKLCFTINPHRTTEQINSYFEDLVKTQLFVGVEIFFPYMVNTDQYNQYTKAIAKYCNYPDIEITLHLPYGDDNNIATKNNIDFVMNRLYLAMDYASNFKIKKLTLHPGSVEVGSSRNEAIQTAITNIQKLCEYANKYQMKVMIENLVSPNELCLTIEEILSLIQLVDKENIGITFDVGHYNVANQDINYNEVFSKLKPYLTHLHLSDNDGLSDRHGPLGSGNIDFKNYLKSLKQINYVGLYSFEVLFNTSADLLKTRIKLLSLNDEHLE